MFNFNLTLRIIQTILALLTVGFNGFVTQWYLSHTRPATTPDEMPFLIFTACLTLLALPYLFLNPCLSQTHQNKPPGKYFNKYAVLLLDALTALLWFAGFVALAVFQNKLTLCAGTTCQALVGGVVVGAIAWASFLASTGLALLHVVRTRGGEVAAETTHQEWVGSAKQTTQVV